MTDTEEPAYEVLCPDKCHLGEGPLYDPDLETAFWIDIVEKKLFEVHCGTDSMKVYDLPFMASVIARTTQHSHLIVSEDGFYLRDYRSGSLSRIHGLEDDNPGTRSNDGRVHPSGALWVGTMGKQAEKAAGSIYWFFNGELRKLFSSLTIPNSICFSPDGKIAYFTDTVKGVLYRVRVSPQNGLPFQEPQQLYDHRASSGGLDGSIVDSAGNIWNARWGAAALDVYSPGGDHLRSYRMPFRQPSCPAAFGPDADKIMVTSACIDLHEDPADWPDMDGATIILAPKFKGRHEPKFPIHT